MSRVNFPDAFNDQEVVEQGIDRSEIPLVVNRRIIGGAATMEGRKKELLNHGISPTLAPIFDPPGFLNLVPVHKNS